jgi:hypothetical protein
MVPIRPCVITAAALGDLQTDAPVDVGPRLSFAH